MNKTGSPNTEIDKCPSSTCCAENLAKGKTISNNHVKNLSKTSSEHFNLNGVVVNGVGTKKSKKSRKSKQKNCDNLDVKTPLVEAPIVDEIDKKPTEILAKTCSDVNCVNKADKVENNVNSSAVTKPTGKSRKKKSKLEKLDSNDNISEGGSVVKLNPCDVAQRNDTIISSSLSYDCSSKTKEITIPKDEAAPSCSHTSEKCEVIDVADKLSHLELAGANLPKEAVQEVAKEDEEKIAETSTSDKPKIDFIQYESELQMPMIMRIIQKDLSEPYSIYTYRYFIHNWPKLCFLAMCGDNCVGAIVCKLDRHRKVIKRGYIAMLAVDQNYRKLRIGSTLVEMAINEMIKGDADEVVLETEVTNKPALQLYEKLGFVRDKRLFRYYLNGVDALRLKLWLR